MLSAIESVEPPAAAEKPARAKARKAGRARRAVTFRADCARVRLLRVAIRLFAARGFHGVAVDQIVEAARINKRMLYHYFGSKEGIYQAVRAEVFTRIESVEFEALDGARGSRERLAGLLRAYIAFLDENPEFPRLLLWDNLEQGDALSGRRALPSKNPFLRCFGEILRAGIKEGLYREDIHIPHLLIHFIGLCFIYHSNRFSLTQSVGLELGDPEVRRQGVEHAITLVFQGIERCAAACGPERGAYEKASTG